MSYISKSIVKHHQKNRIENWIFLDLAMIIESACVLIIQLSA